MTGCGNITERVVRTCCAPGECGRNCNGMSEAQCTGADGCRCVPDPAHPGGCHMPFRCVAEDPYPATCSLVGGCADAVIAGALEVCPAAFVENPRMFGLYADCTEGPTQINGHQSAAAKWHLSAHPIDDLMQAYNAGGWPNTPLRLRQRKGQQTHAVGRLCRPPDPGADAVAAALPPAPQRRRHLERLQHLHRVRGRPGRLPAVQHHCAGHVQEEDQDAGLYRPHLDIRSGDHVHLRHPCRAGPAREWRHTRLSPPPKSKGMLTLVPCHQASEQFFS